MNNFGWEIRPAGWIVLFIVAVVLIYYLFRWLWPSFDKNQQKIY
jgi:hypothetical protein